MAIAALNRAALQQLGQSCSRSLTVRLFSSRKPKVSENIAKMFAKPSWSVSSLLKPEAEQEVTGEERITPEKLHHLLRLSALPLPRSAEEERSMIETLESQLHFVRAVQAVDTTGVEPLVAIRDETEEGLRETEITLASLRKVLDREEQVGRYKRIVKKKLSPEEEAKVAVEEKERIGRLKLDPLERAPEKVGRFIKVNTETR